MAEESLEQHSNSLSREAGEAEAEAPVTPWEPYANFLEMSVKKGQLDSLTVKNVLQRYKEELQKKGLEVPETADMNMAVAALRATGISSTKIKELRRPYIELYKQNPVAGQTEAEFVAHKLIESLDAVGEVENYKKPWNVVPIVENGVPEEQFMVMVHQGNREAKEQNLRSAVEEAKLEFEKDPDAFAQSGTIERLAKQHAILEDEIIRLLYFEYGQRKAYTENAKKTSALKDVSERRSAMLSWLTEAQKEKIQKEARERNFVQATKEAVTVFDGNKGEKGFGVTTAKVFDIADKYEIKPGTLVTALYKEKGQYERYAECEDRARFRRGNFNEIMLYELKLLLSPELQKRVRKLNEGLYLNDVLIKARRFLTDKAYEYLTTQAQLGIRDLKKEYPELPEESKKSDYMRFVANLLLKEDENKIAQSVVSPEQKFIDETAAEFERFLDRSGQYAAQLDDLWESRQLGAYEQVLKEWEVEANRVGELYESLKKDQKQQLKDALAAQGERLETKFAANADKTPDKYRGKFEELEAEIESVYDNKIAIIDKQIAMLEQNPAAEELPEYQGLDRQLNAVPRPTASDYAGIEDLSDRTLLATIEEKKKEYSDIQMKRDKILGTIDWQRHSKIVAEPDSELYGELPSSSTEIHATPESQLRPLSWELPKDAEPGGERPEFKLETLSREQMAELEKNELYWDTREEAWQFYLGEMIPEGQIVTDPHTREELERSFLVNWSNELPGIYKLMKEQELL